MQDLNNFYFNSKKDYTFQNPAWLVENNNSNRIFENLSSSLKQYISPKKNKINLLGKKHLI